MDEDIITKGKKCIKQCIEKGVNEEIIKFTEEFAEYLNNKNEKGKKIGKKQELTTSQIRNIFGAIKKIEQKGFEEKEFMLLKPHLAYASTRGKQGVKDLAKVLNTGIDAVLQSSEKEKAFKNFFDFFESILCYHKAAGGS